MTARINVQKLLSRTIVSLIVPITVAILVDLQFGWFPWVTIVASVIFIPLSTVVVIRAALFEMDRLIQQIAPPESMQDK
ncbi:MAG: hypothetical protein R2932_48935 [Caldilineaceae bacterium]